MNKEILFDTNFNLTPDDDNRVDYLVKYSLVKSGNTGMQISGRSGAVYSFRIRGKLRQIGER